MERQYKIFVAVAAALFAVLILLAYYNPLQQLGAANGNSSDVIKAKRGQVAYVKYPSSVVSLIEKLPAKNGAIVEVSPELMVTGLSGLNGEIRYDSMEITWVQNGKQQTISENDFKSIEYKYLPDSGNQTKYSYNNVKFVSNSGGSQIIVSVKPLSTARVGEQYTIKLLLQNGPLNLAIGEKKVQVVA